MKGLRKALAAVTALCLLAVSMPVSAWGATTKTISSVSIHVSVKDLEPGDRLPTPAYDDDEAQVNVTVSSDRYHISNVEWESSYEEMEIGDEPRLRVELYANNSDEYAFKGSYQASNVKVTGGTFVRATRDGYEGLKVVLRLNPLKGQYDPPTDAYWRDNKIGGAKWEGVDYSSGAYDVYLYKGSSLVKKVEAIKATSYNFYPYMTKEGSYSFKVRTVPYTESEKKYGKKSDWTESDEYYLPKEKVSDGTGQESGPTGNTEQVGWIKDNDVWYYKYPDGTYLKNNWYKINDKWYLFGDNGAMLTGWQQKNSLWYYLNQPNGDMFTGWLRYNDKWYYLNPSAASGVEGAMVTGWILHNNRWYYTDSSGIMVEGWYAVDGNWYYFYPGEGSKAVSTVIDTFPVDENGIWHKP